jgi:hypothetical protein
MEYLDMSLTKVIEVNCETGEEIIRDMNAIEIAELQAVQAKATAKAEQAIEAQAKREAALAKLKALGLDTDDLKALGL